MGPQGNSWSCTLLNLGFGKEVDFVLLFLVGKQFTFVLALFTQKILLCKILPCKSGPCAVLYTHIHDTAAGLAAGFMAHIVIKTAMHGFNFLAQDLT